jgi:hypothetical protein
MLLRQTLATDHRAGVVDRFAEWLLTYCPCSSLTGLTAVVIASATDNPIPRPFLVAAVILSADVLLNAVRWMRRVRRGARGPAR